MSVFPITQRPTLRLRLVRLPSKLRPLHETSFPVRVPATPDTPLVRGLAAPFPGKLARGHRSAVPPRA